MPQPNITSPLYQDLAAMGINPASVSDPVVATAGSTVALADAPVNQTLYLKPAATLATLTVNLPSNANSKLGQECKIVSTQALTALTIGQIGGGATILGAPAGMTGGQTLIATKVEANVWAVK